MFFLLKTYFKSRSYALIERGLFEPARAKQIVTCFFKKRKKKKKKRKKGKKGSVQPSFVAKVFPKEKEEKKKRKKIRKYSTFRAVQTR